jgi:hypothetical protein
MLLLFLYSLLLYSRLHRIATRRDESKNANSSDTQLFAGGTAAVSAVDYIQEEIWGTSVDHQRWSADSSRRASR